MADISLVTGSIDIGDATFSKTTPVGSGTGLYDPFLATHDSNANGQTNDGVAEGFNNDATGILDVDASKTSSLKLSDMPIKVIDGVEYYEFRVDLNETNNVAGRIVTLNEFKIYTSTSPATLANFNNTTDEFGAGFTKVYDLDAGEDRTLILRDDNSGSGTDDYSVLIKVSAFGDVDPTTTYLTLYTNMGRQPGAAEDGGFEEWKTEDVAASITGTKFEDLNGNTVQDPGEGGLGGVTIFLDRDQDGTLDAGERTTVTADDGSYTFFGVGQTEFGSDNVLWIDEVTPDGYTQTTGAHETLTWAGEIPYTVDPIGNQPPAPPPTPAIAIDKVFLNVSGGDGDALADAVGDVLHYTVTVTNTGNVTLTGVTVVDPLTGQNISGVTLAPGANQTFNTSYTLTQADLDGAGHAGGDHDIDNTATASSNETGETQASSTVEVPLVYNPALAIDKEFVNVNGNVGEQADSVGDVLNYAVTVTNTGNVTLTGVTVVDPLTGQNISGVTLAPGASQVFNSAYAITQDDLDGAGNAGSDHDIDNTATAASSQTGEQHATASVEVPLVYDPNLAIEKEFENVNGNPGEQANSVGDVINYRVTVENTGNVTLTGVSVVDPLTGQNVSGIVLAPGESQSFESSYTIMQDDLNGAGNAGADHDIDNVATADSDQTGPGDSNTVEVPLTPEVVVRAFDGEPRPTWSHDHNSDIIWQDFAGGLGDPLMLMGDGTVTSHLVQFSPWPTGELPFWKMQGTGDFNGDGQSEIIWQHDSNNLASLWIMNETDVLHVGQLGSGGQLPVGEPPVFQYGPFGFDIKAIGDINGDGRDDVISQQTNGDVTLWMMDGDNNTADVIAKAGPHASGALAGWHVKGSGDFDGDGHADIIFQHDNGLAAMWLMDGNANTTFVGAVGPFNPGAEWQIKGVGDFDGDGKDDLIWQHDGGQAAMWLMDGTQTTFVGAVGPFNPGADWQIQGTGDFNDDGMSDILWKSTSSGTVAEWHMDGTQATFVGAVGMSQPGTAPLFTGDFNSGDELDWVVYNKTDSYESVFGVDAHGNLDGDQLLAVLNQPISSNANPANLEVPLAKQAVTALLNATNDADGLVTQDYRFTTSDVIAAVQEVYDDGGFDAQQGADLTNLLQFWNEAPSANVGVGATIPGELHPNDTIATTLQYNGTAGGLLEGDIFQVLAGLHPDHGWL